MTHLPATLLTVRLYPLFQGSAGGVILIILFGLMSLPETVLKIGLWWRVEVRYHTFSMVKLL